MSSRAGRSSELQRFLDRWFGIPFLFLLGLFSRKRRLPSKIKRVAFLKSTAIGDTVILSGAITAFRRKFPSVELVLFVGPSNFEAAQLLEGVSRIIKLPVKSPFAAIREIREAGEFDVWFDFGSWTRLEAIYSFFSRSKFCVGFRTPGQGKHFAQDFSVEHSLLVHENRNYCNLLAPLEIVEESKPRILNTFFSDSPTLLPSPYIVFHLWAGGSQAASKEWPLKHWQLLSELALAEGYNIALTGSLHDSAGNSQFLESLALSQSPKRIFNLAGKTLKQTLAILKGARLIVSVDTGLLHLASALGLKVVGIHGPTASSHWGGLGALTISLDALENSPGLINFGYEKILDRSITAKISPQQVWISGEQLMTK